MSRLASMAKLANTFIAFVHTAPTKQKWPIFLNQTHNRHKDASTGAQTQFLRKQQTNTCTHIHILVHTCSGIHANLCITLHQHREQDDWFSNLAGLNYFLDWSYPHYQNQYRRTMRFWSCAILMQIGDRDRSACDFFFSFLPKLHFRFPSSFSYLFFSLSLSFRSFTHA